MEMFGISMRAGDQKDSFPIHFLADEDAGHLEKIRTNSCICSGST